MRCPFMWTAYQAKNRSHHQCQYYLSTLRDELYTARPISLEDFDRSTADGDSIELIGHLETDPLHNRLLNPTIAGVCPENVALEVQ